jgi:hypothetical protein
MSIEKVLHHCNQKFPKYKNGKYLSRGSKFIWAGGDFKMIDRIVLNMSKKYPENTYHFCGSDILNYNVDWSEIPSNLKFVACSYFHPIEKDHDFHKNVIVLSSPWSKYYKSKIQFSSKIPFSEKRNQVVWRGSATGKGYLTYDNQNLLDKTGVESGNCLRIEICKKLINNTLSDVGISHLSNEQVEKYSHIMKDIKKKFVSYDEQKKFKAILCIDGWAFPGNFDMVMTSGSVPIICSNWWTPMMYILNPWEHYIPVKKDLSDLEENISWVFNNLDKSQIIAQKAFEIGSRFFRRETLENLDDFMFSNPSMNDLYHINTICYKEIQEIEQENTEWYIWIILFFSIGIFLVLSLFVFFKRIKNDNISKKTVLKNSHIVNK